MEHPSWNIARKTGLGWTRTQVFDHGHTLQTVNSGGRSTFLPPLATV
jgi:hypothetical protein